MTNKLLHSKSNAHAIWRDGLGNAPRWLRRRRALFRTTRYAILPLILCSLLGSLAFAEVTPDVATVRTAALELRDERREFLRSILQKDDIPAAEEISALIRAWTAKAETVESLDRLHAETLRHAAQQLRHRREHRSSARLATEAAEILEASIAMNTSAGDEINKMRDHYHLGLVYEFGLRNYRAAAAHYREACEIDPEFRQALNRLGVLAHYLDRE